jgi:predicted DNA-binding transcriptional regulator YafY
MPTKKDPYSGPSQKVIGMFSLFLFSGRAHSLTHLAQTFQCSKQTVLRTVEQIERSHWLTLDTWITGREKFYQARKTQRTPNISLDAEGLGKLLLCRDMVWHLLPDSYRREITRTLQGATTLLPDFDDRDGVMASYTLVKPKGMIDYSNKEFIITDLIRAIREHRLCDIIYISPKHAEPHLYTVAPYQMIVFHESLYLRVRPANMLDTPKDAKDMLLAVHRMRAVATSEVRFKAIRIKKQARQFAGSFGLNQGEPFRVQVRVSPVAALYVSERIWSDDQSIVYAKDGGLTLEFSSTSEKETVAWVLSFGGEMELLFPEPLRDKISACAKSVLTLHQRQEDALL